jgi:hypothetical protein
MAENNPTANKRGKLWQLEAAPTINDLITVYPIQGQTHLLHIGL